MELIQNLGLGLATAAQPANLMFCFIGALLGTAVGVLPGVGPLATIAMLLPITFKVSPEASIIMLAGIYYGAQYGGSTTAILINLPGEASSAVTACSMLSTVTGRSGRGGGVPPNSGQRTLWSHQSQSRPARGRQSPVSIARRMACHNASTLRSVARRSASSGA